MMPTPCPHCSANMFIEPGAEKTAAIRCGFCGFVLSTPPSLPVPRPSRYRRSWATLVGMLRAPGDRGVGDTVQRIAAKFGGERFKVFAEKIGLPCGCDERRVEWNEKFPY